MANLTIYETFPSREGTDGDSPSSTTTWIVMGTSDDLLVGAFVAAMTPSLRNGLVRQQITKKETAPDTWECQCRYGAAKPPKPNDYKFSFDTSGGKQKITQSIQTLAGYASGGATPTDYHGAIGVTDHSVGGCEIVVPKFSWSETWQLPVRSYGWPYAQTLKACTGKVNAYAFRGFAPGTVLFHGGKGSASSRDPDLIEITYTFEQSDDVSGQQIGGISGVDKPGWAYLWIHYSEEHDTSANALAHRPDGVYVEQVYYPANFGALGIGS